MLVRIRQACQCAIAAGFGGRTRCRVTVLQLEEGAKERPIAIPDEEIDVDKYIINCMIMKVVNEEPRKPVVKQEPTDRAVPPAK